MFRLQKSLAAVVLALFVCALPVRPQTAARTPGQAAQSNNPADALKPYTACQFEDGLEVSQVDQLPKGVKSRTVETLKGERKVSLAAGYRVLFAYPKTDIFANVKAEQSNPDDYARDKEAVIENLKWAVSKSKEMETQEPVKVAYNGLEGYAIGRKSLVGNTLGITLLFDDAEHTIVTVYFLNQRPDHRKFSTVEEWRALRDRFLERYTACAHGKPAGGRD